MLGDAAPLIESAAWLHDIGYAEPIAHLGFHPVDGARFLRSETDADELICRLVAHHTAAEIEAGERHLPAVATEFEPPPLSLLEALIYCDMTASVDGQTVEVEQRLAEILTRYPANHVVHRSITRSAPLLRAATDNTAKRLTERLAR
jgi:HD superfamily phosphodiesterase